MGASLFSRLFGFASRQVEAFERRQDQRLETMLERLDGAKEGLGLTLDALTERLASSSLRQHELLDSRRSEAGQQQQLLMERLAALETALGEQQQAGYRQQQALGDGLAALRRALESVARGMGQGSSDDELPRQILDAVNALASTGQAWQQELRARMEDAHNRQGDLARLLVVANEELKRLTGESSSRQFLELNQQMDAVAAAFLDQRGALQSLAYQLRAGGSSEQLELVTRLEAVESALTELRLLQAGARQDTLRQDLQVRFDALEGALAELRLNAGGRDDANIPTKMDDRFDALEGALAELRLSAGGRGDANIPAKMDDRFDALEATLTELRLSAGGRGDANIPAKMDDRFDALEAALTELRLAGGGGETPGIQVDLGLRLDALEGTLSELRLDLAEDDQTAGGAGEICTRLDALEGALSELRLGPPGDNGEGLSLDLGHRLETVESALSELRLQLAAGSGDAQIIRREVGQRFEELEAAMSEMRLPLSRLSADAATGQESREQLAALEATLAEQRLTLQQLQENLSSYSPREVTEQLAALEAIISEENLAFSRLVDSSRDQQQVLRQEFDALEGIITDQRHALHKLVTSFDSQGYAQRLEVQKRLSALDTELRSMLTAIEAGISDQRYALVRLAGSMAQNSDSQSANAVDEAATWDDHTPISQILAEPTTASAGAALPGLALGVGRHPDIEHKLGIVLDCLLADHLASLARAGREAGDMDPQACQRLTDALDELKLKRLRSRHHPGGEDNEEPGS